MKTWKQLLSFLILAGLLLTLCGFGTQTEPLVLAHSSTQFEGGADYLYNAQGQLTRKIQGALETRYQYYEDGTIKAEAVYRDGKAVSAREYDEQGTLTRILNVDFEGIVHITEEYINRYDDQSRLTHQTRLREDSLVTELSYTYGKDGTYTIELSDYYDYGDKKEPHCHRTATFTEDGTQIAYKADLTDMASHLAETTVTLDRRGNPESSLSENTYGKIYGKAEYTYVNTYNASGKLLQRYEYLSRYEKEGNKVTEDMPATLWTETEYVYDAQGRLINERSYSQDQGFGSSRSEKVWEYDPQGNLLRFYGDTRMSDLDYFLQGKGDPLYTADETYTYAPLSQVLDTDPPKQP